MVRGWVQGWSLGDNGKVMGSYNDNPILNSIVYDVEFPDGQVKEYAANILAENMMSQVDPDGPNQRLMEAIVDCKKKLATVVPINDKYLVTRTDQRKLRKTTQGWSFLVRWKDGTESWVKLVELKDSYAVEVAVFAKSRSLVSEPAFALWVPHTIRRWNAILSALKARLKKKIHKYGIEIPRLLHMPTNLTVSMGWTLSTKKCIV